MHLDRRRFLGAGAAVLLRGAAGAEKPHRIDIHHHLFPPTYNTAIVALGQPASPAWTPARSIDEMDKSGIATSVVSLSPPAVAFPDIALARGIAREANEYAAKMARDYPAVSVCSRRCRLPSCPTG
jgi:6-methylsalicylate decarboxylase